MNNFLNFPLHIEIKITNRCNLKCIHCISNGGVAAANELTKGDIFKIIKEAAKHKAFMIGLTGGEPFLRNDIFDIIDEINSKKIEAVITTNGTLLTEETVEKIKNKVSLFRISLDHCDPAKHDYFRGVPGSFEKAIKAIELLKRYKKYFQLTTLTVVSKYNLSKIDEIIDYLEKIGVESANIFLFAPAGRGVANKDDLCLNKEEIEKFCKYISQEKKKRKKIKIHTANPLMSIIGGEDEYSACPAAFTSCFIMEDGRALPCPYFYKLPNDKDNIRIESLKNIWLKSKFFNDLRSEDNLSAKCRKCDFHNSCFGGCRAGAFMELGDINKPDPMCWL